MHGIEFELKLPNLCLFCEWQGLAENRPWSAVRNKEDPERAKSYLPPTKLGHGNGAARRQRAQSANPASRTPDLSGLYIQRSALRHDYESDVDLCGNKLATGSPVLMRASNSGGFLSGASLHPDRDRRPACDAMEVRSAQDVVRGSSPAIVQVRGSSLRVSHLHDDAAQHADAEAPGTPSPRTVSTRTNAKRFAGVTRRVPHSTGWVDISPTSRSKVWAKGARPSTGSGLSPITGESSEMHLCVGGNSCVAGISYKQTVAQTGDVQFPTYWKGSKGENLFHKRTPAERSIRPLA